MLRLYSKITFTPVKTDSDPTRKLDPIIFDFVNIVDINTSHKDLTSTAKITIPRKLTFDGKEITKGRDSLFRRGDKVKIELGYFPNLTNVFEGYISNVNINAPIVIECQDNMFLLHKKRILYPVKFNTVTKEGKRGKKTTKTIPTSIKLEEFIKDVLLEGTGLELKMLMKIGAGKDMKIDVKRFDCSAAQVLDKLKDTFKGLYAYFQEGVLNVGFEQDASESTPIGFEFEENIIDDTRLVYREKEDFLLQVRATTIDPITNQRIVVTVGDEDGSHRDIFSTKYMSEKDLREFANLYLNSKKYTGYVGEFTTFGENYIRPGDIAKLTSKKYPEKNGDYLVSSVRRTFGMGGYRQEIELGTVVSSNTVG